MNDMEKKDNLSQAADIADNLHAGEDSTAQLFTDSAQPDRLAQVLDRMRSALEVIWNHPRVREDGAATAILVEMAAAESMADVLDCSTRLDARLRSRTRRAFSADAAGRRPAKPARTLMRL